ncbi:MAG TPA: glycine cleavage system aminomethyltransferase GcvT, partial [Ktedonobacterales bacterium]
MQAETPADAATPRLKRTPLFELHRELGARLVEFGGWEMPVQYRGILDEHRAVRERAGLFDVSHMGEFRAEGPGALDFLQSLVPNNVARLAEHQALYTQICRPDGGTLDDLLIYRLGEARYMIVVNAGTMEKDWAWFAQHAQGRDGLMLTNIAAETALLAVQGPLAEGILRPLTDTPLGQIAYYHCQPGQVAGLECLISRTGYTGEDGFELYAPAAHAADLWRAVLAAGQPAGLLPAGLGARDTLRLESGYCLYDHELTEEITPLEAGLAWTVKLEKGTDFIGREALAREKADGPRRRAKSAASSGPSPPACPASRSAKSSRASRASWIRASSSAPSSGPPIG